MLRSTTILALFAAVACGRRDPVSYRTEPVSRGPVSEVVSATGDVSAIVTVNVGSQMSGIIEKLYVDFNSEVKKGQLLATLDSRLFRAQLEKAEAGLASAVANLEKAQVALADAERVARRQKELREEGLVSQADLESGDANRDGAAASLSGARASVLQAKADRDLAMINLAFTKIQSPIDGIVVSRNVDVGQTVAAALQAPTLFMIANDLTKMQILANIDEADVGKVRAGLPVKFTVDAYPGETFTGTIHEVRQAPTTIQNVVTYAAVVDAPNPERKLRQGMTTSVMVTAARHENVLRVANAALRWKPEEGSAPPEPTPQPQSPPQSPPQQRPALGAPMARSASPAARGGAERSEASSSGRGKPPRVALTTAKSGERSEAMSPARGKPERAYLLEDGRPVAVNLRVGLSDGLSTEVLDGLVEGDRVIVGGGEAGAPQQRRRGLF